MRRQSAQVIVSPGGFKCRRVFCRSYFHGKAGPSRRNVQVDRLVIAGWTGRDKPALEKHIAELEALGVKRPASDADLLSRLDGAAHHR